LAALLALALTDALARDAAPAPDNRGLLYRIDAPGKPPSWVFGTIHLNDPRVTAIPAPVMAALASSRRLAPEVVLSREDMPAFFAATAQQEDGRRLSEYFDADAMERLRVAIGPSAPPAAALDHLKPWVVWLMLDRGGTISTAPSLDELLIVEARARRMTVFGLELPEEQVASLDALPQATQVALLRWAVASRHRVDADREAMIEAWLARDLRRLAALAEAPAKADVTLAPHLREVSKHLVENRNIVMAHRLFLPLRDGHVFVAVGALHLVGPGSLLALIRAQGYRVTRVY
jgi:uncharacterized protein YbaP (TraB family)